ncbi:MAG: heavy metal translocating P-type ATPase [Pseudomonadota bacterium]
MMTTVAACPACTVAPAAETVAQRGARPAPQVIHLSLPAIHCAGCIGSVERTLRAVPGVASARVNLSLKRATVEVDASIRADSLVAALKGAGHDAQELDGATLAAGDDDGIGRGLLIALGVSGFAMMNVMLLSVAVWSGAEAATRDFLHWVSATIALPSVAFAARPFFKSGWNALRAASLNMDVPISLAILLAAAMSLYETAAGGAHAYFDAALSLTFFLLLGRYLDHRTRVAARSAARELTALEAPKAVRLTGQQRETVTLDALAVGDLIHLAPGMRAPVDGVITDGMSDMDRAPLTGETIPVPAAPGTEVQAGEMNLTGALTLRITTVGEDTSLRRMAEMVATAERGKGRYASLADRAARIYAPGVHLLALIAFLGWMGATGDLRLALNIAVAVLIITCPCALGLAAPAVATAAAGSLFRRGVLLKDGTAMERLAEIDAVVFDKTGTLTTGTPRLASRHDPRTLSIAAGLAQGSAHPYARAIAASTDAPAPVSGIREVPGKGVEGMLNGITIRLGNAAWLGTEDKIGAATFLTIGDEAPLRLSFADDLRPGAADLVASFRAQGLTTYLLSGDGEDAVKAMGTALQFDHVAARITPEGKLNALNNLATAGHKVLMVGDGLNDTGALAAAHVSAAQGSGLDAARTASDIILLNGDLNALGRAVATARSARRRILENFAIAGVYNLIAVPIALAGFATPLIAALAMSASSITVSLNALRVK